MRAPAPCLVSILGGSEPMLRGNELKGTCHSECEIEEGWPQKTMENTVRNCLDFLELSYLLSYLLKRWEHLLLCFFFFTTLPPNPSLVTFSVALSPTMNLALLCCICKPIQQCTMKTGNDFLGFLLVLGLLCQLAQWQRLPPDPSLQQAFLSHQPA